MGWVGSPIAVGWSGNPDGSYSSGETMTHELGHNMGREHVACRGDEDWPDTNYPYWGGLIGTWGLDVATGTLYKPGLLCRLHELLQSDLDLRLYLCGDQEAFVMRRRTAGAARASKRSAHSMSAAR